MPQEDEQTIVGVKAGRGHRASSGGPHRRPEWDGDVDAGMGFVHDPRAHLTTRDEPLHVQRPVRGDGRPRFKAVAPAGSDRPYRPGTHQPSEIGIARNGPARARHAGAAARNGWRFDTEHLAQLLVVRFRAIQRGCELLDPAVLDPQSRDLALQPWHPRRIAHDWSGEREEQHDEHRNRAGAPLPPRYCPAWETVLFGFEIAVGMNDDRDAARAPLHPSKAAPRIISRSRAR